MYPEEIEALIKSIVADGQYTDKEKRVLHKKAKEYGIDKDEIDVYVEGLAQSVVNEQSKPVEAPAPQPLMNEKMGNVRKCPNCGAVVPAGSGKCAECGYVFVNISANRSSQKLAEELKNSTSPKDIILNFPIPTGKEDLIEFLITMDTKRRIGDDLSPVYNAKYNEAKLKAIIIFPDDVSVKSAIQKTEVGWTGSKLKNMLKETKTYMIVLMLLGFVFVAIGKITDNGGTRELMYSFSLLFILIPLIYFGVKFINKYGKK